jgi:predicted dithiol-disulfide oxidoreductase (DUF899 family)
MARPEVVSREQWLDARRLLLEREKDLTRRRDALNADRRRLPMVRVDKEYYFEGPEGRVGLADLFDDRRQLIIHHIMFGPDWDDLCPRCTNFIGELSPVVLDQLWSRQTAFALVARAPFERIEAVKKRMGWTVPFYSSYGTSFNYDFQVTLDEAAGQITYNYRQEPGLLGGSRSCELPGASCFLRDDGEIYHTYSAYARGLDHTELPYAYLDLTALGRQEEWEERLTAAAAPAPAAT